MLQIAKILKSNGTCGDILLGLRDIDVSDIDLTEPVFIYFDGLPVPFFFDSLTPKGTSKAIAHITDVDTLSDAEELVGQGIFIDAAAPEEEAEDIVGWTVFNHGNKAGQITGTEPIPGNPCIYIGDVLVPLHPDFIENADPKARELYLNLPEGLL